LPPSTRPRLRELENEALAAARADKLLAQEEVWIRKGVEARRTRSVGRVARLVKLREQRAQRRDELGQVRLELDAGLPPGKIVAELKDISMRPYGEGADRPLQRHDPARRQGRPDRPQRLRQDHAAQADPGRAAAHVGQRAPGHAAAGGLLRPDARGLNLDATLVDTISPGSEWIEIGQEPKVTRKHVMSYLSDFLFSPERANSPVRTLSGGERNRLLLARLFALPANVLVLDEPTNDLDIDTLDLLEDLLQDYGGTVFLVSHDRRFLDNVVTSTIAWEGDPAFGGRPGLWREYEGGYEDWKLQRERTRRGAGGRSPAAAGSQGRRARAPCRARSKLSYKEQRELDALPAASRRWKPSRRPWRSLASADLYVKEPQRVPALQARHEAIDDGTARRAGALGSAR
jgi:ATP-binding cassette subfamily F protein uup